MNLNNLAQPIFEEWQRIAASKPQERLPWEAQTRCVVYAALRPEFRIVRAESGHGSIIQVSHTESDLWATSEGRPPVFIEIKHAWSSRSLNNQAPEQIASWMTNLAKLEGLPTDSDRYFLLVGFFEGDPLRVANPPSRSVLSTIQWLHATRLVHRDSTSFLWRNEGITHMAFWLWHWPAGEAFDGLAGPVLPGTP